MNSQERLRLKGKSTYTRKHEGIVERALFTPSTFQPNDFSGLQLY